jgi:hypothetical protein
LGHKSKAIAKSFIGRSEFIDWMAYYRLRAEREKEAIEKAKQDAKRGR